MLTAVHRNVIIMFCAIFILLLINKIFLHTEELQKTQLFLYKDNGNRVRLPIDQNKWNEINAPTNKCECTARDLRECDPTKDFECFQCRQMFSACVHFEMDTPIYDSISGNRIITMPHNKSADTGYCLRIASDRDRRSCTAKFGGQWVLMNSGSGGAGSDNEQAYLFVCHCANENLFTKSTLYGDCDVFVGCPNGKIANNGWDKLSDIECDCDDGYTKIISAMSPNRFTMGHAAAAAAETMDTNMLALSCVRNNVFQEAGIVSGIDHRFVDPDYVGYGLAWLPDPCSIDALTGKPIPETVGHIAMHNNVAYCVASSKFYTTVLFEDDYLLNNGGRYANGILKISNEAPLSGIVYEMKTKRQNSTAGDYKFKGVRYNSKQLTVSLPYFDYDSANMGGPGAKYKFAAMVPKSKRDKSLAYVYQAESPIDGDFELANVISFLPVVISTPSILFSDVRLIGAIPFKNVPLVQCNQLPMVKLNASPPGIFPLFSNQGTEMMTKFRLLTEEFRRFYYMPLKCLHGEKLSIQYASKLFTGIFLTQTNPVDKLPYTSVISPGDRLLVERYRKQINEWQDIPADFELVDYVDEHFTLLERNDFVHGSHSFGVDCDGISMPPASVAHYTCNEDADRIEWPTEYSSCPGIADV